MNDDTEVVLECIQKVLGSRGRLNVSLLPETILTDHLDSLGLIQLVALLEKKFSVRFQTRDLMNPSDWKSPMAVTELLRKIKG